MNDIRISTKVNSVRRSDYHSGKSHSNQTMNNTQPYST